MKKALLLFCVLSFYLHPSQLFGVEFYYLPQAADGAFEGGSLRTSFLLFNPTATSVTATISLTDDQGETFPVTIPGFGNDDRFGPISLAPGQSRVLQTDGTGALRAGAAQVEASSQMAVSSVFSVYDTNGVLLTEGGVGPSTPLMDFVIPVDTTDPFNTGLALFNPSEQEVTANIILFGSDGSQVDSTSAHLLHFGHLARFVAGQGGLFPAVTGFRGTLRVHTTQPVVAVTLRQHADPLSNTTLPVVAVNATETQFDLPQVANGQLSNSSLRMRTTFIAVNVSSAPANVNFTLRKGDGTPLAVTIPGGVVNNSGNFARLIPSGGSAFLQTDGSGTLEVGSAHVASDVPIGVAAIFTLHSGEEFLTEAGVGNSPALAAFTLPVDVRPGANTGVALVNPNDVASTVTLRLYDAAGQKLVDAEPFVLAAHSQTAKLVSELVTVSGTLLGSLAVTATQPVAAVTLRQNNAPVSYTTLPVAEGTVPGP